MNNSEKFIPEVERRLHRLFSASKEGYQIPDDERHRLTGFIHAGIFMGIATNKEMQNLMEAVHFSIFGKTITERKESQHISWDANDINYDQYERPTFERVVSE